MKKQSRTVPRRRQSVSPTPRHLPLVDILIDTQAELQELVVASGLKVLEAMLEEDRAAVCGPRYAHQPARQAYRTGHTPSQVVLGGRKVAIRRPRARRVNGNRKPHICGNRKLHTPGEDVSGGADILPVMPVGRVGLDAGSGATGVQPNTRREAAEPAVTLRLPHAVRPTLSSASADAPASGSCCPGC